MSDVDDFFGGGAASAKFPKIGTKVSGVITAEPVIRQQTDFDTGKPLFWDDGKPRQQMVVIVQTDEGDGEEDDGQRALYLKGNLRKAVGEAIRKAKVKGLAEGGTLTVEYTADGKPASARKSAPKLYAASYTPPAAREVAVPSESGDLPF